MDMQVILSELADLRAKGLSSEVYNQLIKMIHYGLYDPNVIYPYIEACLENKLISNEEYDRLMEIFEDDGLTLEDEIPFY